MRKFLICGASILVGTTSVLAQTASGDAPQEGLEEIIVTANRRAESSQRSALSIQAIGAEELARAGVTRPEDISKIATGVDIGLGGNMPQVYIRGVGTYGTNNYAENAVAINLDGAYISRGWQMRGAFFDLERIEALKGPQGTLYGRNASGGAINLITIKPSLGETQGYAEGEVGNYNLVSGNAAVNVPLGDHLAMRLAGQAVRRDGYNDDGTDDQRSESSRLHLLYDADAGLSFLLTGFYQHDGGKGVGNSLTKGYGDNAWRGSADPLAAYIVQANNTTTNGAPPGFLLVNPGYQSYLRSQYYNAADPINAFPANVNPNLPPFKDATTYGVSAEMNWDFDLATLTVLPAYRYGEQKNRFYVATYELIEFEKNEQESLEIRLGNQSDLLKWVVGAYYFNEEQGNLPNHYLRLTQSGISGESIHDYEAINKSYAAFGQATYSVTDTLRLTGGLRYTYEKKTQDGLYVNYAVVVPPPPAGNCVDGGGYVAGGIAEMPAATAKLCSSLADSRAFKSTTWKTGFEFDAAPRSLIYGNVSTGFKSGGFYAGGSFQPEKLTAFELGSKNRFFDNRLQINLEAFYYRYRDQQQAYLGPTTKGYYTLITSNVGRSESYGGEVSVEYQLAPADTLSFDVQYNGSKYKDYRYLYPTASFGPPFTGCAVGVIDSAGFQTIDCSGLKMVRTPTWTGNVGYSHVFDLEDGSTVTATGAMRFSSGFQTAVDFLDGGYQDSFNMYDADLTYQPNDGAWSFSVWGQNLTKTAALNQSFRSPFVANPVSGPDGLILGTFRAPRTYGVRFRVHF